MVDASANDEDENKTRVRVSAVGSRLRQGNAILADLRTSEGAPAGGICRICRIHVHVSFHEQHCTFVAKRTTTSGKQSLTSIVFTKNSSIS